MSVLDVLQKAARRLNIPRPSSATGSNDPQVNQLLQLLEEDLEDALSRHDWNLLTRTGALTATGPNTVAGVSTFAYPADQLRMRADTVFFHTGRRAVLVGPASSRDWLDLTSGIAAISGLYWRPYGLGIQVCGMAVGDTVVWDYLSRNCLVDVNGAERATVGSDTDRPVLPERLCRLGVIWRWRQAKGLDYAEDLSSYERELERVTSFDAGLASIATAGGEAGRDPLSLPNTIVIAH